MSKHLSWAAALLSLALSGICLAQATPVETHPRLWFTSADIPRLRSWAVASNPIWEQGLRPLAERCREEMDRGEVPGPDADNGGYAYVEYPAEAYAKLFAFMSLVSPSEAERADYAQRARTLLMFVINKALPGAALGQPYRDPEFSTLDRSRWHGESFGLTVDWIYPSLSSADKAAIRTVFLRWVNENKHAPTTGHDHPEPVDVVNDPVLLDRTQLRWSMNNYFTAHMRNIGLMALSFDAADDPDGSLRGAFLNVAGAWLYITDEAMRTVAQGGLGPEGFEYFPQTFGYAAQLLLAIRTSGRDDTARYGRQVSAREHPFWGELVSGYLHSNSPGPVTSSAIEGPVYAPAWYGSGQIYWAPDTIAMFGPLALLDEKNGNDSRSAAGKWISAHLPPGGAAALAERTRDTSGYFQNAILYFLLFDPTKALPADPRPSLPLSHFAPGLGRILARTAWETNASWFTYKLSFNQVDHQSGDGNQFELFRKGEWLVKERSGYDLDYGSSLNHNTLAIENDRPYTDDPCRYRGINWAQGSQWAYVSTGDPVLLAHSEAPSYVFASGDATNLYNSEYEGSTDVLAASRDILWIKPDHIVVYDRAETKTANRFKRFWLSFTGPAAVSGSRTTATTPKGQKLHVSTLLPRDAAIAVEPAATSVVCGEEIGFASAGDPVVTRLRVEAPGGPARTRFLHVLEATDGSVAPSPVTLIESTAGTPYAGAVVRNEVVLFPVETRQSFNGVTYTVPAGGPYTHRITGLAPGARFSVSSTPASGGTTFTVAPSSSGSSSADSGGVLVIGAAAPETFTRTLVVPIVLSSAGLGTSFFTTELALTNRGTTAAELSLRYTAAAGGGTGSATTTLAAGRQLIVPNAIEYLRELGIPIPAADPRRGTLQITFSNLSSPLAAAATARTTTAVPDGRAGLAYSALSETEAFSQPVLLHGLRQNATDRSNVAVLNAGPVGSGDIRLAFSVIPDGSGQPIPIPDEVTLAPGGFFQISGILAMENVGVERGSVRVARVSGSAPFYAYGVINDQSNSDGSFVPPVVESSTRETGWILPVLVEAGSFTSELVLSELSGRSRSLSARFVAASLTSPGNSTTFSLSLGANEKRITPDFISTLRERGVAGIGPPGSLAGALFVTDTSGDSSGLFLGARTSAPGGGGRYGVFYPATASGRATSTPVWLYGLQQNSLTRSNLALVNTGETDSSASVFRIEIFDGDSGLRAASFDTEPLASSGWTQIGMLLLNHAPGVSNAYVRVTRLTGSNPFLSYAVVNDGPAPDTRTGDGAYLAAVAGD